MGKVIAGNRISFQIIKTKPTMSSSYTLQIPIKTLSYHQCVIDYNDDELRSSNNKSAASLYWKQGIPLKLCARACVCVWECIQRFLQNFQNSFCQKQSYMPNKIQTTVTNENFIFFLSVMELYYIFRHWTISSSNVLKFMLQITHPEFIYRWWSGPYKNMLVHIKTCLIVNN